MKEVLKDSLTHGMSVVFCGTAVGTRSALRCAYYAGIGNAFWKTVHEIGLTPMRLEPEQYRGAAAFGIGFTDLALQGSLASPPKKVCALRCRCHCAVWR